LWDPKKSHRVEGQDKERARGHLVLRPLRFRDGTPHPCAKVPAMRFRVVTRWALYKTRVQLLCDYLLLSIGCDVDHSLSGLYLIAWKQGAIILVSLLSFIIGGGDGDDDDDSSANVLWGSMELSI
jgi:hypothetical protein